jgi:hypothetical protein
MAKFHDKNEKGTRQKFVKIKYGDSQECRMSLCIFEKSGLDFEIGL